MQIKVTWLSTWPPSGQKSYFSARNSLLNCPYCHERISYTCMHVISQNLLFAPHCRSVEYILRLKYTRLLPSFGLYEDCWAWKYAISFSMLSNLSCCSTGSEPLKNGRLRHQTINFHSSSASTPGRFLLSQWCRTDCAGSCMLYCLPCSSILLCKQVLCCCRSSFASRQTSCTCTSSARKGFPVLLRLAMV